jgi:hypothetical protein
MQSTYPQIYHHFRIAHHQFYRAQSIVSVTLGPLYSLSGLMCLLDPLCLLIGPNASNYVSAPCEGFIGPAPQQSLRVTFVSSGGSSVVTSGLSISDHLWTLSSHSDPLRVRLVLLSGTSLRSL